MKFFQRKKKLQREKIESAVDSIKSLDESLISKLIEHCMDGKKNSVKS